MSFHSVPALACSQITVHFQDAICKSFSCHQDYNPSSYFSFEKKKIIGRIEADNTFFSLTSIFL